MLTHWARGRRVVVGWNLSARLLKKRKKEKRQEKERSWSEREEGGKLGIGKMPQRKRGNSKTNIYLATMQHEAIWRGVATASFAKHNLSATRAHVKSSGDGVALAASQERADVQSKHVLFSQSTAIT